MTYIEQLESFHEFLQLLLQAHRSWTKLFADGPLKESFLMIDLRATYKLGSLSRTATRQHTQDEESAEYHCNLQQDDVQVCVAILGTRKALLCHQSFGGDHREGPSRGPRSAWCTRTRTTGRGSGQTGPGPPATRRRVGPRGVRVMRGSPGRVG